MVPAWMVYATVVGVLAAAAALALDRLLGVWALPRRAVWLAAMLLVSVAPFALARRTPARPAIRPRVSVAPTATSVAPGAVRRVRQVPWQIRVYRWSRLLDGKARVAWAISSATVALVFGAAYVSMRRRRASWREGALHGHDVLLTNDVGPAVVGFIKPCVVIPQWALALPESERRLMLEHERSHITAGDPQLLLVAGILLVLFPWNAPLWWMARRLRLSIEIDCDARVIRGTEAADEYGLFLIAVGERRTHGLFLAASLAERRSSLERRIHAMTMPRPRHPILVSLPLVAIALGAATLAAQTPVPAGGAGGAIIARAATPPVDRIQLSNDQVRLLIAGHHPAVASGTSEDNIVTIVLASNGDYVMSGASKAAVMTAAAGAGGAGGGFVSVAPTGTTPAAAAGQQSAGAARVSVLSTQDPAQPGFMNFPGVGSIDRTLVKDLYSTSYAAGEVSTNALRVRFITLTGNRVK